VYDKCVVNLGEVGFGVIYPSDSISCIGLHYAYFASELIA